MDHFWTLYLLTRLDSVKALCTATSAIFLLLSFVSACIALMAAFDGYQSTKKYFSKVFAWVFSICVLSTLLGVLTPTKKDAMFIAGGVAVVEAVKSETAQRLAGKSVKAVEAWLDDLSSTKKEENHEK